MAGRRRSWYSPVQILCRSWGEAVLDMVISQAFQWLQCPHVREWGMNTNMSMISAHKRTQFGSLNKFFQTLRYRTETYQTRQFIDRSHTPVRRSIAVVFSISVGYSVSAKEQHCASISVLFLAQTARVSFNYLPKRSLHENVKNRN